MKKVRLEDSAKEASLLLSVLLISIFPFSIFLSGCFSFSPVTSPQQQIVITSTGGSGLCVGWNESTCGAVIKEKRVMSTAKVCSLPTGAPADELYDTQIVANTSDPYITSFVLSIAGGWDCKNLSSPERNENKFSYSVTSVSIGGSFSGSGTHSYKFDLNKRLEKVPVHSVSTYCTVNAPSATSITIRLRGGPSSSGTRTATVAGISAKDGVIEVSGSGTGTFSYSGSCVTTVVVLPYSRCQNRDGRVKSFIGCVDDPSRATATFQGGRMFLNGSIPVSELQGVVTEFYIKGGLRQVPFFMIGQGPTFDDFEKARKKCNPFEETYLNISLGPETFEPSNLTYQSGTQICWQNYDSKMHNLTVRSIPYNSLLTKNITIPSGSRKCEQIGIGTYNVTDTTGDDMNLNIIPRGSGLTIYISSKLTPEYGIVAQGATVTLQLFDMGNHTIEGTLDGVKKTFNISYQKGRATSQSFVLSQLGEHSIIDTDTNETAVIFVYSPTNMFSVAPNSISPSMIAMPYGDEVCFNSIADTSIVIYKMTESGAWDETETKEISSGETCCLKNLLPGEYKLSLRDNPSVEALFLIGQRPTATVRINDVGFVPPEVQSPPNTRVCWQNPSGRTRGINISVFGIQLVPALDENCESLFEDEGVYYARLVKVAETVKLSILEAETHKIEVRKNSFKPYSLAAKPGDTVCWINVENDAIYMRDQTGALITLSSGEGGANCVRDMPDLAYYVRTLEGTNITSIVTSSKKPAIFLIPDAGISPAGIKVSPAGMGADEFYMVNKLDRDVGFVKDVEISVSSDTFGTSFSTMTPVNLIFRNYDAQDHQIRVVYKISGSTVPGISDPIIAKANNVTAITNINSIEDLIVKDLTTNMNFTVTVCKLYGNVILTELKKGEKKPLYIKDCRGVFTFRDNYFNKSLSISVFTTPIDIVEESNEPLLGTTMDLPVQRTNIFLDRKTLQKARDYINDGMVPVFVPYFGTQEIKVRASAFSEDDVNITAGSVLMLTNDDDRTHKLVINKTIFFPACDSVNNSIFQCQYSSERRVCQVRLNQTNQTILNQSCLQYYDLACSDKVAGVSCTVGTGKCRFQVTQQNPIFSTPPFPCVTKTEFAPITTKTKFDYCAASTPSAVRDSSLQYCSVTGGYPMCELKSGYSAFSPTCTVSRSTCIGSAGTISSECPAGSGTYNKATGQCERTETANVNYEAKILKDGSVNKQDIMCDPGYAVCGYRSWEPSSGCWDSVLDMIYCCPVNFNINYGAKRLMDAALARTSNSPPGPEGAILKCGTNEVVCGAQNKFDANWVLDMLWCCPTDAAINPSAVRWDDIPGGKGESKTCNAGEVSCGAVNGMCSNAWLDFFGCCVATVTVKTAPNNYATISTYCNNDCTTKPGAPAGVTCSDNYIGGVLKGCKATVSPSSVVCKENPVFAVTSCSNKVGGITCVPSSDKFTCEFTVSNGQTAGRRFCSQSSSSACFDINYMSGSCKPWTFPPSKSDAPNCPSGYTQYSTSVSYCFPLGTYISSRTCYKTIGTLADGSVPKFSGSQNYNCISYSCSSNTGGVECNPSYTCLYSPTSVTDCPLADPYCLNICNHQYNYGFTLAPSVGGYSLDFFRDSATCGGIDPPPGTAGTCKSSIANPLPDVNYSKCLVRNDWVNDWNEEFCREYTASESTVWTVDISSGSTYNITIERNSLYNITDITKPEIKNFTMLAHGVSMDVDIYVGFSKISPQISEVDIKNYIEFKNWINQPKSLSLSSKDESGRSLGVSAVSVPAYNPDKGPGYNVFGPKSTGKIDFSVEDVPAKVIVTNSSSKISLDLNKWGFTHEGNSVSSVGIPLGSKICVRTTDITRKINFFDANHKYMFSGIALNYTPSVDEACKKTFSCATPESQTGKYVCDGVVNSTNPYCSYRMELSDVACQKTSGPKCTTNPGYPDIVCDYSSDVKAAYPESQGCIYQAVGDSICKVCALKIPMPGLACYGTASTGCSFNAWNIATSTNEFCPVPAPFDQKGTFFKDIPCIPGSSRLGHSGMTYALPPAVSPGVLEIRGADGVGQYVTVTQSCTYPSIPPNNACTDKPQYFDPSTAQCRFTYCDQPCYSIQDSFFREGTCVTDKGDSDEWWYNLPDYLRTGNCANKACVVKETGAWDCYLKSGERTNEWLCNKNLNLTEYWTATGNEKDKGGHIKCKYKISDAGCPRSYESSVNPKTACGIRSEYSGLASAGIMEVSRCNSDGSKNAENGNFCCAYLKTSPKKCFAGSVNCPCAPWQIDPKYTTDKIKCAYNPESGLGMLIKNEWEIANPTICTAGYGTTCMAKEGYSNIRCTLVTDANGTETCRAGGDWTVDTGNQKCSLVSSGCEGTYSNVECAFEDGQCRISKYEQEYCWEPDKAGTYIVEDDKTFRRFELRVYKRDDPLQLEIYKSDMRPSSVVTSPGSNVCFRSSDDKNHIVKMPGDCGGGNMDVFPDKFVCRTFSPSTCSGWDKTLTYEKLFNLYINDGAIAAAGIPKGKSTVLSTFDDKDVYLKYQLFEPSSVVMRPDSDLYFVNRDKEPRSLCKVTTMRSDSTFERKDGATSTLLNFVVKSTSSASGDPECGAYGGDSETIELEVDIPAGAIAEASLLYSFNDNGKMIINGKTVKMISEGGRTCLSSPGDYFGVSKLLDVTRNISSSATSATKNTIIVKTCSCGGSKGVRLTLTYKYFPFAPNCTGLLSWTLQPGETVSFMNLTDGRYEFWNDDFGTLFTSNVKECDAQDVFKIAYTLRKYMITSDKEATAYAPGAVPDCDTGNKSGCKEYNPFGKVTPVIITSELGLDLADDRDRYCAAGQTAVIKQTCENCSAALLVNAVNNSVVNKTMSDIAEQNVKPDIMAYQMLLDKGGACSFDELMNDKIAQGKYALYNYKMNSLLLDMGAKLGTKECSICTSKLSGLIYDCSLVGTECVASDKEFTEADGAGSYCNLSAISIPSSCSSGTYNRALGKCVIPLTSPGCPQIPFYTLLRKTIRSGQEDLCEYRGFFASTYVYTIRESYSRAGQVLCTQGVFMIDGSGSTDFCVNQIDPTLCPADYVYDSVSKSCNKVDCSKLTQTFAVECIRKSPLTCVARLNTSNNQLLCEKTGSRVEWTEETIREAYDDFFDTWIPQLAGAGFIGAAQYCYQDPCWNRDYYGLYNEYGKEKNWTKSWFKEGCGNYYYFAEGLSLLTFSMNDTEVSMCDPGKLMAMLQQLKCLTGGK